MAVRMAITMAVSLYASRVVLAQLGVVDFGIYSVVGALAMLMGFFNSAMAYAMQRFMNVELGVSGGKHMQDVFAACCVCAVIVAGLFVVVAEVLGMWFLDHFLSIPADRIGDARIVFQLTLLIVAVELLRVPYNSLIIAHERMSFFAYNSILEALLKLMVVISLSLLGGDKLLIYAALLVAVSLLVTASYVVYGKRCFPSVRFSLNAKNRNVIKIVKFSGWNMLTCVSDLAFLQGSPMILNVFFGVTLNATMGIANQVKTAVYAVTRGMQVASNPQIVKSYASGCMADFHNLIDRISRISFYIVLFIGLPILLNTDFILGLWLDAIPPDGVTFVRLMIIFCIVDSLTGPLWISMQATGRIATYQIVMSSVWLMSLPLIWVGYQNGLPPYWLLLVWILIDFALLWVRVIFSGKYCGFGVGAYAHKVILPIIKVTLSGCVIPVALAYAGLSSWPQLLITGIASCVSLCAAIYLVGINRQERDAVKTIICKYLRRNHAL